MNEYQLMMRVEAALADEFRAQVFRVDGTIAYQGVQDDDGYYGEIDVDPSKIAQHLIREGLVKS
jgi:Fe-S cluster biogenesis protein NfuA